MTRTERSQYPAALLKDRHSRTGQSKTEQGHKHGAGAHNWGAFTEEGTLEWQGANDAAAEEAMFPDDDVAGVADVADARAAAAAAAAATDEAIPGMPDKHRRAAADKGDGAGDAASSAV